VTQVQELTTRVVECIMPTIRLGVLLCHLYPINGEAYRFEFDLSVSEARGLVRAILLPLPGRLFLSEGDSDVSCELLVDQLFAHDSRVGILANDLSDVCLSVINDQLHEREPFDESF